MTFRITIAVPLIPWPGGGTVMACAFIGFVGGEPLFVVSRGQTPYGALQGVFAQAVAHCAATAVLRNGVVASRN